MVESLAGGSARVTPSWPTGFGAAVVRVTGGLCQRDRRHHAGYSLVSTTPIPTWTSRAISVPRTVLP